MKRINYTLDKEDEAERRKAAEFLGEKLEQLGEFERVNLDCAFQGDTCEIRYMKTVSVDADGLRALISEAGLSHDK